MLYSRLLGYTRSRLLFGLCFALLVLVTLTANHLLSGRASPTPISPAAALEFGRLPLSFVPNAGQADPAVRFQAHSAGGTLFFTPAEVVLVLPTGTIDQRPASAEHGWRSTSSSQASSTLRVRFEGANQAPRIVGGDQSSGIVNYFIGNDPIQWRTNLPTYGSVIYRGLYPGIDLRYHGTGETQGHSSSLKGTYTVLPGADPTRIRWRYEGAASVDLDRATGDLLVRLAPTSGASNSEPQIIERAPVGWQMINEQRMPVDVRYVIADDGSIGFELGGYAPAYPLIIDPTLTYSSYLGGSSLDYAEDIAVDAQGNAYIVGRTRSIDFPTQNPLQPDWGGGFDVFVVKVNPTGSALVYATYLGGSNHDTGYAIAVDGDGSAYLTGDTISANFPTKNAVQPTSGGGGPLEGDAFVVKLDATGSALVYATYLGGGGDELSYGIALDALGNAYVTGYTGSTDFPTRYAPQPDPAFGQGLNVYGDAFVTQVISASGVYTWGYSTYLGGVDWDEGHSIALDSSGIAYVTGNTRSTDFPTAKPAQPVFGGGTGSGRGDAFVTQVISTSGVYTWGYSTYLGGSGNDSGNSIAVDDSNVAYVTGETASMDFPTANPLQNAYGGDQDAFVTQIISASGVYTWGYSTYLGGEGTDLGQGVAVDSEGDAYLTGYSFSSGFPTSDDAYDAACGSDGLCDSAGGDVFFTQLNGAGDALAYSTYLGGSSTDFGSAVALDGRGNVYLAGHTYSTDFPTTSGAYDATCGTDGLCNSFVPDAFAAKITMAPDLVVTKAAHPPAGTSVTRGDAITYTIVTTNLGAPATDVLITDKIPPGTSYVSGSVISTLGSPGYNGTQVTVSVPGLSVNTTLTATFEVTVATDFTTFITNKAVVTFDPAETVDSNSVQLLVQGTDKIQNVYLPLVLKVPGEAPPSGCAPYWVATIGVGDTPRGIAINSTQGRVYVANYGSNSLSVIDSGSNMVIQSVTGITSATGVAYDPHHNLVWVTNYDSDQVTPINASSLAPLASVAVGDGPWGVAYDQVHDAVYVVNSEGDSVTVLDAATRAVTDTLSGGFNQPFHAAANPVTGKVYVTNFGDHSVAVVNGTSTSVVNLNVGNPSTQPYGVAVDETRDLVYVATVDSHRLVVIGTDAEGNPDQLLGWAALHRGFGDPARPVPLRVIAVNPDIGPLGDGGHVWATTGMTDGSEANQVLLIPKGWDGYFDYPSPYDLGANPSEGIAVDRVSDRVYVSSGSLAGTVTVLGDSTDNCLVPFSVDDGLAFEISAAQ